MTIHHINATTSRLVRVARKMEAELQDFVDAAKRDGSQLPFVEALLHEWHEELRASGYVLNKKQNRSK